MTGSACPPVDCGRPDLGLRSHGVGADVLVVSVAGELDLATVPQLRAYLVHTTAHRPAHLVLDLSGVTLLAASGVGALLAARDGGEGIHGRLHLTGVTANRRVRRTLEVTGLLAEFDVHDDTDDLLRRLGR